MEKVRLIGDPVLTTPCTPVDIKVMPWQDLERLILSMTETMNSERGVGLAANQIGHSLRVFIMRNDDLSISEYINPVILHAVEPVPFEGEACLSVPGISTNTTRYNEVTLSWIDKHGTSHHQVFRGLKAFAVQHEMDHLDGKLYLDLFGPVKRNLIMKKYKKALKKSRR